MIKKLLTTIVSLLMITTYSQNDTIKSLDAVTITALRFKLESVSSKTIQIDSVKNYFSQETPYFFSSTPSIITQSDNGTPFGYSYFSLRGMGQNRINYTLNGVPLNDGEDLVVYTSNYTDLLNSLRSVQVVRGSGVSSNGASSYIGLVNMDLDSPFDYKKFETNHMFGSFNSRKNSIKFNTGTSKRGIGATLRVSETYTDGFRNFSSGKSFSLSSSLGYKNNVTSVRFNIVYGQTKNTQSWLPVPEGSPVTTNILTIGFEPQYDNFKSGIYQLQVASKFLEKNIFNLSAYYTHVDGNYDFPIINLENLKLNSKNWGGYYNLKHINNGLTLQTGFTINSYNRRHEGTYGDYVNLGEKFDVTVFTKVSYKIALNWILEGDYQFRTTNFKYKNENFESKLYKHNFHNYSFGISYRRINTFKPYISFSKSSREPSRTNLFGYNDNPLSEQDITKVKPEIVNDIEVGTKIDTKHFKGSVNIYSMRFTNEIISIGQLNSMGIMLGTNAQKSSRVGLEVDLTLKKNKLEIGTTFNYSKNRIKLNDLKSDPVLTPNFNSNVFTNYKIGKFNLGVNYKYVTKSFLDVENNFICPEYHIIDSSIGYSINKNSTIRLFINNILNRNWTTGGSMGYTTNTNGSNGDPYRQFYYTAGTNFYITFNYRL